MTGHPAAPARDDGVTGIREGQGVAGGTVDPATTRPVCDS